MCGNPMLPLSLPICHNLKFYCWDTQDDGRWGSPGQGCGTRRSSQVDWLIIRWICKSINRFCYGRYFRYGNFILASFLAGLRGKETLKLALSETCDYIHESENHRSYKYVVSPLRGRFKGEGGENFHFASVTAKN